jgi:TolA-binding protein
MEKKFEILDHHRQLLQEYTIKKVKHEILLSTHDNALSKLEQKRRQDLNEYKKVFADSAKSEELEMKFTSSVDDQFIQNSIPHVVARDESEKELEQINIKISEIQHNMEKLVQEVDVIKKQMQIKAEQISIHIQVIEDKFKDYYTITADESNKTKVLTQAYLRQEAMRPVSMRSLNKAKVRTDESTTKDINNNNTIHSSISVKPNNLSGQIASDSNPIIQDIVQFSPNSSFHVD